MTETDNNSEGRRSWRERLKAHRQLAWGVLSYAIAAACLIWVFRGLNFHELVNSFSKVNLWLVAPSVFFVLLVYFIAGWEWQLLLRPAGKISVPRTTQAVFAGHFANDVLPVHMGYVIRVLLVARWMQAKVAAVAPSLLVERLLDGFWLALGIGLTAIFFHLPPRITRLAEVWAALILVGIIIGAMIVFTEPGGRGLSHLSIFRWKWVQKIHYAGDHALEQIRAIGRSWLVLASFTLSFFKLASQFFSFLLLIWAYGFDFGFGTKLVVFFIAYVGISMPSTPASFGIFQLFCIAGLQMAHVPKVDATAFSLLAFLVMTIPLSVGGFIALAQTGMSLRGIQARADHLQEE